MTDPEARYVPPAIQSKANTDDPGSRLPACLGSRCEHPGDHYHGQWKFRTRIESQIKATGPDAYVDAMRKVGTPEDVADAEAARGKMRDVFNSSVCDYCGDEANEETSFKHEGKHYCQTLHAAMSEARDHERARIAAWLRSEDKPECLCISCDLALGIEAGAHERSAGASKPVRCALCGEAHGTAQHNESLYDKCRNPNHVSTCGGDCRNPFDYATAGDFPGKAYQLPQAPHVPGRAKEVASRIDAHRGSGAEDSFTCPDHDATQHSGPAPCEFHGPEDDGGYGHHPACVECAAATERARIVAGLLGVFETWLERHPCSADEEWHARNIMCDIKNWIEKGEA